MQMDDTFCLITQPRVYDIRNKYDAGTITTTLGYTLEVHDVT